MESAAAYLKCLSCCLGFISILALRFLGLLVFILGYLGARKHKLSYAKFAFFGSVAALVNSILTIITFSVEFTLALIILASFSLAASLVYICFAYHFMATLQDFRETEQGNRT